MNPAVADGTAISWVHDPRGIQRAVTLRLTEGCTPKGRGCLNCWARHYHPRRRTGRPFSQVIERRDLLAKIDRWRRPRRVFVSSESDFFHEWVSRPFQLACLMTFALRPEHTFLLLTKRPEIMKEAVETWQGLRDLLPAPPPRVPPNVWLGVSVEDQATADERIPLLLETPAAVRFVSYEPALGPVNFEPWIPLNEQSTEHAARGALKWGHLPKLDWLILGGESGPGHRPMEMAWLEDIVRQCDAAGVPVFVKQDSGRYPDRQGRIPDALWARKEWPK